MTESILIGDETCYGCGVRCKRVVEVPGKVDPQYGGPEYETCATFGSYCGISNLETILHWQINIVICMALIQFPAVSLLLFQWNVMKRV